MLGATTYTVKRTGPGSYDTGVFVPGAETTFDIVGSLQPLSGTELLMLTEGERRRARWKMYSFAELRIAELSEQTAADRVVVNGAELEVHSVAAYQNCGALDHYKYVLVEVGEDE